MDFSGMMKQAKAMAEQMKAQQEAQKAQVVEGEAGGGMVRTRMNGAGELVGLDIDKSVVDPEDPEMLADLILAAVAAAQKKCDAMRMEGLKDMTGGMDLSSLGIDLDGLK